MPLTDSQCRTPNRSGRIEKRGDGGGLFLVCSPGGAKRWTLAYRFGGKQRDLAIGPYPGVTLAEARVRREEAKVQLQRGTDPAGELVAADTATLPIFRDVARRWLEVRGKAWTKGHVDRTAGRLRLNVYPFVGDKPLDQITSGDVLAAVRACEKRGAIDMGRRTAQAISSVFRFAKADGLDLENPGEGLNEAFAARRKVRRRAMIAPKDVGGFLVDLQGYEGEALTRLAIEFVIRTAVRTSELRLGTRAEVERDLWRIPPERMKMGGLEQALLQTLPVRN